MTTTDLIAVVSKKGGMPLGGAKVIVDAIFGGIAAELKDGGRIELRGFGVFTTRVREARVARNPRTGESVNVPAKRMPHFKAGKDLVGSVNG
jgi:integration host factor subunit beta